jgi:thioredoxin-related protein
MEKMNNKTILIIGLGLIVYSLYNSYTNNTNIIPGIPVVVVPNMPFVPELTKNIYYDEYDKCKDLASKYNKKLVLVFGADWCPYCRVLKKDIDSITGFKKYIVCFIDTDKNKELVQKYRIKGLPTSVIIDHQETELARKTGYKQADYNQWLDNSLMEEFTSWIDAQ